MIKKQLQGFMAGALATALSLSGVVVAKSKTEMIEVTYDNIKVYKDHVLCELKDANGSTIEPFIYQGTTYMPVRGTATLADMSVTWDGASKSVFLWDETVPEGTYLMEVCPPYETSNYYNEYLQQSGRSFQMAGAKYSNGFSLWDGGRYAMVSLNSKYSSIDFTVGHIDGSGEGIIPVSFFVDGKLVKEIEIKPDDLPKTVSIPVNYGLQLKVVTGDSENSRSANIGFGNITVQ